MMSTSNPTIIVVIGNHPLFREGLREILESNDDLVVAGEAGDEAGAVAVVAEHLPHVVLLDVRNPLDEVTTMVRRIRKISPASGVVVLSMHEGQHFLQSLLREGIRGFLLESVSRQELVSMIRGIRANDDRVLLLVSREGLANIENNSAHRTISQRELQVLQLAAEANSNRQIAHRLGLTEATVKRHMSNIYRKLGAVSRIDAVNKAAAASLIADRQADAT